MAKKDNSTFRHKVALRKNALERLAAYGIDRPTVMETHGGFGALFNACYDHLTEGVVFEKDSEKTTILGKQRLTWAVYEADCIEALKAGVGGHLAIDLLDIDPYGCAWDVIDAFMRSARPFAPVMAVAVNDGVRENLEMGTGWKVKALREAIDRHGNDLHPIYLDVCRELMDEKAAKAGYTVSYFGGYYCGLRGKMTHYLAMLEQAEGSEAPGQ